MEEVKGKAVHMIQALLISYTVTCVLLLILSAMMFGLQLTLNQVNIGIGIIYAAAAGIGGFVIAKKEGGRRLWWGLAMGMAYFAVLALVSFLLNTGDGFDSAKVVRAAAMCIGAGAAGAILG